MEAFIIEGEYIQLNQLLKALFWVGTGGEAMLRISQGEVQVNGVVTTVKRKKLYPGDTVSFNGQTILVQ
ncbi:ribosome-associated protein [Balneicella halophila]|uniref:Ribosome-associated protein n=1 Tax=Balneicella halophila TaxID=1537566 RepID=A0A7L4UQB2_BALHA|nr:RNA-binding S4 domain-containing protein [Balneicella halophila]PVX51859.1 ribosome-associated protein [Balneicella halophila]